MRQTETLYGVQTLVEVAMILQRLVVMGDVEGCNKQQNEL